MELYDAILKRRTVRRFRPEPITGHLMEKILNAGRLAPSGGNKQAWHFISVTHPETVAQVFPLVRWAAYLAPEGTPKEGERPTAYIVVLVDEKESLTPEADACAATMNMILCATDLNIGTCWMGSVNKPELSRIVHVPRGHTIKYVIALGYPAESPVVEEAQESIKYYKDEKGTLHVPKKRLREIVSTE